MNISPSLVIPRKKPLDMTDKAFYRQAMKKLVSVISHEWLEESESSSDVIRLDSPSTSIFAKFMKTLSIPFTIQLWVLISCLHL
jgi:hypothetical protein